MKKLSKSTYGFIFAIVLLCILLAISLYLGISGWFFTNSAKIESDVSLGENLNFSVSDNGAETIGLTFVGSYLPKQKLSQNISITNISDKDLYVRAKAVVMLEGGETDMSLGTTEHWQQEGEYYYFDEKLPSSNKIALASYLGLPDKYFNSTKRYVLTIVVESLDASLDIKQIWGYEKM